MKKILTVFLMLLFISVPSYGQNVYEIWDFNSDNCSWNIASNKGTLETKEEFLRVNIIGGNAQLAIGDLSFSGAEYPYIIMRIRNNTPKTKLTRVQFKTAEEDTFTTDKIIDQDLNITANDTEFREYSVYLGDNEKWANGTIKYIGLAPATAADSGYIDFDYIYVSKTPAAQISVSILTPENGTEIDEGESVELSCSVSGNESAVTKVEYYNNGTLIGSATTAPYSFTYSPTESENSITAKAYTAIKTGTSTPVMVKLKSNVPNPPPLNENRWDFNSDNCSWGIASNKGTLEEKEEFLRFNITGGNAQLCKSGISFSGAEYPYIIMRIRNNTPKTELTRVQFKTVEEDTFTTDKIIDQNLNITANDTEFREYSIYLGNIEKWTNGTIKYIGLAPATGANSGYIDFDYIYVSNAPAPKIEVSILTPENGTEIDEGESVELSCSVSGNESEVTKVEYYNNGTLIGSATTAPYSFTYSPTESENSITAKAYTAIKTGISIPVMVKLKSNVGKAWEMDLNNDFATTRGVLTTHAGVLKYDINAKNSNMSTKLEPPVSGGDFPVIAIRMKNNIPDSVLKIQFKTTQANKYTDDKTFVYNEVICDEEFHEYYINMPKEIAAWTGDINGLQIYPSANADSGTVYIDYIRLLRTDGYPVVTIDNFVNHSFIEKNKETTLQISVNDNGNEISYVEVFCDNKSIGKIYGAPYTLPLTISDNEAHYIYATAVPKTGNKTGKSAVTKAIAKEMIEFKSFSFDKTKIKPGDTVSLNWEFVNYFYDKPFTIAVGLYKDGILTDAKMLKKDSVACGEKWNDSLSIGIPVQEANYELQAVLWDTFFDMNILKSAISLK